MQASEKEPNDMTTKDYTVQTKLGAISVHPVTATQVYMTFEDLPVFGVPQNGSFRIGYTGGAWGPYKGNGDTHGFHALHVSSRWNGQKHIEVSRAAKEKLASVLTADISAWLTGHPEVLTQAASDDLDKQIVKASGELEALQKQVAEVKATLAGLVKARAQFFAIHQDKQ